MARLTGKTLKDRYQVTEFIGCGGMAKVYKVWDNRRNTYLAMKLLHEDLALNKVFNRHFKREAQNLAQLQHPNIVRFYGVEQDGFKAFMLMNYVEGVTLKHKIFAADRSGMEIQEIRKVTRALCSALQFAHSEGLIHCDLKPGNVMINRHGTVLLADFGIARMTDAATDILVGVGTPAYMAPEQVKGLDPVPQTDIYALGVILYEMLTGGERPFTGIRANTTGTTSAKVRWEQINLEPPSPRKFNPGISPAVENVVLTCLAKDPHSRYRTPLELYNALERAVKIGEPKKKRSVFQHKPTGQTSTFPSSPRGSSTPWWQRYRSWISSGGILFLLGCGVLLTIFLWLFSGRESLPDLSLLSTDTPTPYPTLTFTPSPTLSPTISNPSFCPDAIPLSLGDTYENTLVSGGEDCYRFQAQADQFYTFLVESFSYIDSTMTFLDLEGNQLDFDDEDGGAGNPRLSLTIEESGVYFIIIEGYDESESGEYTISVFEGLNDSAFSGAIPLPFDAQTDGAITSSSLITLESYDFQTYGVMYTFRGQANEQITIDVFADSLGSDMDPIIILLDYTAEVLANDDDGGSGLDAQLTYHLPQAGDFYVFVLDAGEEFGSASDFFYEILITYGLPE